MCVQQGGESSLDTMALGSHNASACAWSDLLVAPAVEGDEQVRTAIDRHVHAFLREYDSGLLERREGNPRYELSSVRLRIKLGTAIEVVVVGTGVRYRRRVAICSPEIAVRNIVQVTVRSRTEPVTTRVQVPVLDDRCVEDDACNLADGEIDWCE